MRHGGPRGGGGGPVPSTRRSSSLSSRVAQILRPEILILKKMLPPAIGGRRSPDYSSPLAPPKRGRRIATVRPSHSRSPPAFAAFAGSCRFGLGRSAGAGLRDSPPAPFIQRTLRPAYSPKIVFAHLFRKCPALRACEHVPGRCATRSAVWRRRPQYLSSLPAPGCIGVRSGSAGSHRLEGLKITPQSSAPVRPRQPTSA